MSEPSADLRDTWATFCDLLRESGDVVLRVGTPDDALDHAEGYRMLTRLLRCRARELPRVPNAAAPGVDLHLPRNHEDRG